ncbi:MAG: hypothetical protein ACXVHL_33260 [Solirubrobacteraceae bacterium]
MPAQESGGTSFEEPGALSEKELLARLQELVDTRPTEGNCPVEWAVPAYFLGDMDALAVLSLRSRD